MNEAEDLVSQMWLAGAMVAYWSLTQEVAGLSPFIDTYFRRNTIINPRQLTANMNLDQQNK